MTVVLPSEIILETLELAARQRISVHLGFVAQLRLVCRSANRCMRLMLFDTVHIDDDNRERFFALLRGEPVELWATVRHLAMTCSLPPLDLQAKFLAAFQHVRAFSLHTNYLDLLSDMDAIRPSRLFLTTTGSVASLLDLAPAVRTLTHLRVVNRLASLPDWTPYAATIPYLTHLCTDVLFIGGVGDDAVTLVEATTSSALRAFPHLERLVIRIHTRSNSRWKDLASALEALRNERLYILRVEMKERDVSLGRDHFMWMRQCATQIRVGRDPWNCGQCFSLPEPTSSEA